MHTTKIHPSEIAANLSEGAAALLRLMAPSCRSAQGCTDINPAAAPSPERRREIESAVSELLEKELITAGPSHGRDAHRLLLTTTNDGKAVHYLLIEQARAKAQRRWMLKTEISAEAREVLLAASRRATGRLLPTGFAEPMQSDIVSELVKHRYASAMEHGWIMTDLGRERALAETEARGAV